MNKRTRQKITAKTIQGHLKPLWGELNRSHFEGTLKRCPKFILCPNPKFLAAYSFTLSKADQVSNGKIIFSENFFYHSSVKMFQEALLHEMAHQFIIEVLHLPHQNHGPIWKMICRALGINPHSQTPWTEN